MTSANRRQDDAASLKVTPVLKSSHICDDIKVISRTPFAMVEQQQST
jgi:hypothetical protein